MNEITENALYGIKKKQPIKAILNSMEKNLLDSLQNQPTVNSKK